MAENVFKRWKTEAGGSSVSADINVTPLVDVVLVLLIIFMVITPMLQVGAAVKLPKTDNPDEVKREDKQKLISLKEDLSIFIENNKVSMNMYDDTQGLDDELKALFISASGRKILIKADKSLKYKDVRVLMKRIQGIGFNDVGLIVDRSKPGS
jgi:biopolymer transport protein ExbD